MRKLLEHEGCIVQRLLTTRFPGRDQVRAQLHDCMVEPLDENGSLKFFVAASVDAPVVWRIPKEGEMEDEDGMTVHVLLHVVEGKVAELEVYKDDSSRVVGKLDPLQLQVFGPE